MPRSHLGQIDEGLGLGIEGLGLGIDLGQLGLVHIPITNAENVEEEDN